jgi:hypothetical protein
LKASRNIITYYFLAFLSVVYFGGFLYIYNLSPGLEGGMDSYQHFLIAKYSWKYPVLFLHQWGKPVFTLIASPFAQLGIGGNVVLNLLSIVFSAWLCYFTAKKLNFKYAVFSFLAVLFSPIFFDQLISGLTEPLCALLLSILLFALVSDKIILASIIAGFMPYARSEGFMIMAVVGFYVLFIQKNYKAFIWVLAGSFFMNTLGWIIEGKSLWIFTENPYIRVELEKVNICGKGGISHYLRAVPLTFGFVGGGLTFLGISIITYRRIASIKQFFKHDNYSFVFWIVAGIFSLYFLVHSAIWYLGVMGSCGYIRVMTVIVPCSALLANYSIDAIAKSKWLVIGGNKIKQLVYLLLFGATLFMVWEPFWRYKYKYPIDISDEQKLFVETGKWLKTRDLDNRVVFFLYPYLNIIAEIDPWDIDHFIEIWGFHFEFAPLGSYIIWDGHFGPNEGKIPLEKLRSHPDFKEIKSFYPPTPFKTLNDYNFEIHVFERIHKSD